MLNQIQQFSKVPVIVDADIEYGIQRRFPSGTDLPPFMAIAATNNPHYAYEAGKISAMHDPTEGGISSGLVELANSSGLGMVIHRSSIKEIPVSKLFCPALGLDPLGLIASGALLACVPQAEEEQIMKALTQANIPTFKIGKMTKKHKEIKMVENNQLIEFPRFATDELARFLSTKK